VKRVVAVREEIFPFFMLGPQTRTPAAQLLTLHVLRPVTLKLHVLWDNGCTLKLHDLWDGGSTS
jgi:hypothetical protein